MFGTRGSLARRSLPDSVEPVELGDALTAALAADGYARATGKPAILVTFGRDEALSAASVISLSWGDRIPLLAVSLLPEQEIDRVCKTYEPVVRTALRVSTREDTIDLIPRLAAALKWDVPAHVAAPEGVDVASLLDSLCRLAPPASAPSAPAPSDVEVVASAVRRWRRPVILLGVEAVQRADYVDLALVAQKLRCPVLLTAAVSAMAIRTPSWDPISKVAPVLPNPNTVWELTLRSADGILALGTALDEADLFGLRDLHWHRGSVVCVGDRELGPARLCPIRIECDPGTFLASLASRLADEPPQRRRARWQ
ncbi:MAG: thiamine pyrophosphate-binding protein, partial [Myxococcota bacterium]